MGAGREQIAPVGFKGVAIAGTCAAANSLCFARGQSFTVCNLDPMKRSWHDNYPRPIHVQTITKRTAAPQ